jgi:endonuclease YncB( thermonuclease family)
MRLFLLFLLVASATVAQAEIYQWTDESGQAHFSDKPHSDAKILNIHTGHSYYQIKKIYDGDTILLSNGQKVRFLGINTPEVEGRYKSAQAGGEAAKQWLKNRLHGQQVRLDHDVEKQDKYGRLLAHIFTKDGQHINLELIEQGLATVSIFPPNMKYTRDLIKAEQHAEQEQVGLWQRKEYNPKKSSQLTRSNYKGWQRITGKVIDIHHARKNSYLTLSTSFSLKISKRSLNLFPDLNDYKGKKIEVRGWVSKRKEKFSMFIRHPSQILLNSK